MFVSNFLETGFLNTMRGITFAAPTQAFVGLFLSSPTETGTGGIEISYTGYARMPITFAVPTVESGGIGIRNNQQITFAQSPVDAGTVRHIGIFDSPTGGNMYLYGELTEDLPVMTGESPVLLINEVLYFSIGNLSAAYKKRLFNVVRGTSLPGFTPYHSLWNGHPENGGSELSGLNYARVPLTFSSPSQEASGMSIVRNTVGVSYNRPTTNWGNWTDSAIMDRSSSGEPVWSQQRTPSKLINKGIMPIIEPNAISVGLN